MELGQRLDLAKLGLDVSEESPASASPADSSAASPDGDALAQLAGLLARIGAVDDAEEVTASDTLDSLGVDSLDRIEFAVRAEEHFGVRVSEETWLSLATLGEAAEFFGTEAAANAQSDS